MSLIKPGKQKIEWLEIICDYRCNSRCKGCYSSGSINASMSGKEVLEALFLGRSLGASGLWIGGGEPTLRKDLFSIVSRAASIGYSKIRLQTNGMLLAYPDYAKKCRESGITDISFSVKGASESIHDHFTSTPGSHRLLMKGIEEISGSGINLECDFLIYRDNLHELEELVRIKKNMGFNAVNMWLFSAFGPEASEYEKQVPKISDLTPRIFDAFRNYCMENRNFLSSHHTPPCTLPEEIRHCSSNPAALKMLVVNPGSYSFMLETSPFEGGFYMNCCNGCPSRSECGGARKDYVDIYGENEFGNIKTHNPKEESS